MGEAPKAVRVVKTSFVPPDVETPNHRLFLSNLDQTAVRNYTPTFYVFRSNGDPDFFSADKLKASLSKALVPFYPLAGRLVARPDGRVEVDCNAEGILFVEAESDSTVDEFGDFVPSPELKQSLVPPTPSGEPPCIVTFLQLTRFKCGGVSLGVANHHCVVDGLSALHFIGTWANFSRGVEPPSPPFLDRTLLGARSPPKVVFEPAEYHDDHDKEEASEPPPLAPKDFSTAVLNLSADQLAALKNSGEGRLGTFKAVMAHVWRCLCKARKLAHDADTRLHLAVDIRARLNPPLPRGFFGNAVLQTFVTAKVGDVVSDPLQRTGNKIQEAISVIGDEHVRSTLDFLELQGDLKKVAHLAQGFPVTDLLAISWLGLPIYEADFGWGPPELMRRASLQMNGMVYPMHRPSKDGGICVVVSLEQENMVAFEKAFYQVAGTVAADT